MGRIQAAYVLLFGGAGSPAPPPTPGPGPVLCSLEPEQGSLQVTFKYWTEVQRSRTGLERRICRAKKPREVIQLMIKLDDATVSALRSTIFKDTTSFFYVPMTHESVLVLQDVTGTTVNIDSTYCDWTVVNQPVIVTNPSGQMYTALITGLAGTPTNRTLTLDHSPNVGDNAYPAYQARIAPLRKAYAQDGQSLPRYIVNLGEWAFSVDLGDVPASFGSGATLTTFDGMTVITQRPRTGDAGGTEVVVEDVFHTYMESLDSFNNFENRTAATRANLHRSHNWFIHNLPDWQYWKAYFQNVLGRQKVHLLPTWRDDLELHTQPLAGATTLIIESTPDYVNNYFPSTGHRYLQLEHADGTVEYVKVTAAVDSGTGTQSLTLSAGVTGSTIVKISLLEQVRLNSDEISVQWDEGTRALLTLEFMTVPQ